MSVCSACGVSTSRLPAASARWISAASASAVPTGSAAPAGADAAGVAAGALGRGFTACFTPFFAVAALRDDINVVSLLHHLVAPQLEPAVGDAFAGLDVVLVAVPGADEVGLGVREVEALRGLVGHDALFDLGDDQPLAGRAALVQAVIAVGVEFAAVLEHADLGVAHEHDPAVAVLELRRLANELLGHGTQVLPEATRARPRWAVPSARHVRLYITSASVPPARPHARHVHDC